MQDFRYGLSAIGSPFDSRNNPTGMMNPTLPYTPPTVAPAMDLSGLGNITPMTYSGGGISSSARPPEMPSAMRTAYNSPGGIGASASGSGSMLDGLGGMVKSTFMNADGGLNLENITGILGSIGGLWGASKQLGLMKDQLNFQKDAFNKNYGNQVQSYNTALSDRARARGVMEGQSQDQIDSYVDRNRLR